MIDLLIARGKKEDKAPRMGRFASGLCSSSRAAPGWAQEAFPREDPKRSSGWHGAKSNGTKDGEKGPVS